VTDAQSIYSKCRADVAAMLGYDLDKLSAEQATRLDVSTALRVLLDNQSARLVRGESLDARELLMASEALSRLLPPLREPPPDTNREDPRAYMWRTYLEMRRRGELADRAMEPRLRAQIDQLRAENESLRAAAGGSTAAITPPTADIVPPGEWRGVPPMPGPDDPPRRSSQVIDGKAVPTPAAPAEDLIDVRQGYSTGPAEPWREFCGGGPGYDRWSNRN
jgi:hypothetical protein